MGLRCLLLTTTINGRITGNRVVYWHCQLLIRYLSKKTINPHGKIDIGLRESHHRTAVLRGSFSLSTLGSPSDFKEPGFMAGMMTGPLAQGGKQK